MEPRISLITLGVTDLARAARSYRDVLKLPQIPSPPEISFFELGKTWLSLFPREELAADAGVPAEGSGFRGFTLAHNLPSAAAVDKLLAEVASAVALIVKPAKTAENRRVGRLLRLLRGPGRLLMGSGLEPAFPARLRRTR